MFKNIEIFKLPNKSGIKPRNNLKITTFNNTTYFANTKKFDINKLKYMKPEYKQIYRDLIHKKIKLECESAKKKKHKSNNNDRLNYKLNSFLDNSIANKDSQILFRLNSLKYKILKNKNHSYFSSNKNISRNFEDNQIMKSLQDSSFLPYKSFKKYSKNRFNKNININNNYINNTNNNNIKLIIQKYQNDENENDIKINTKEKEKILEKYLSNNNGLKCEKEQNKLISEYSKLKNELEYTNNQLEKYKKYQELYLNLLKKVKSNKHSIKSINLNDEKNIKQQYINELIDRGNEINKMLKEDNILENNLKNIIYKLE